MKLHNKAHTLELARHKLASLKTELGEFYVDPYDVADEYHEMLEGCYEEPVLICGMAMDQADILKRCDPVGYREGLLNYADFLTREGEHSRQVELQEMIEDAEDELEELEDSE